jgi:hypothetical protein
MTGFADADDAGLDAVWKTRRRTTGLVDADDASPRLRAQDKYVFPVHSHCFLPANERRVGASAGLPVCWVRPRGDK